MCSNSPTFSAPLVKWTQTIVDELNEAIANCQCGPYTIPLTYVTYSTLTNVTGPAESGTLAWSSRRSGCTPAAPFSTVYGVPVSVTQQTDKIIGTSATMGPEQSRDYSDEVTVNADWTYEGGYGPPYFSYATTIRSEAVYGWLLIPKNFQLAPPGYAGRAIQISVTLTGGIRANITSLGQLPCNGVLQQEAGSSDVLADWWTTFPQIAVITDSQANSIDPGSVADTGDCSQSVFADLARVYDTSQLYVRDRRFNQIATRESARESARGQPGHGGGCYRAR